MSFDVGQAPDRHARARELDAGHHRAVRGEDDDLRPALSLRRRALEFHRSPISRPWIAAACGVPQDRSGQHVQLQKGRTPCRFARHQTFTSHHRCRDCRSIGICVNGSSAAIRRRGPVAVSRAATGFRARRVSREPRRPLPAAIRPGPLHQWRDGELRRSRGWSGRAGPARAERQLRRRREPPLADLPGSGGHAGHDPHPTTATRSSSARTPSTVPELADIVNGGDQIASCSSRSSRASGFASTSTPSARSTSNTARDEFRLGRRSLAW